MTELSRAHQFPLVEMVIGDEKHWLPMQEAGRIYDSGMVPVQIGGLVLEATGRARDITDEERTELVEIADRYSDSK